MTKFYRVVRAAVKPLVALLFRVKYFGVENFPDDGGIVLCCNHTSLTDVAFLAVSCKRQIFFMAKEELFKNKVLRWFFTKMGAFAVMRGKGDTGALDYAEQIVLNGGVMGIFPEGRRVLNSRPTKAKTGAAVIVSRAQVPVVPVSIYHEGGIKLFKKVTVRYGKPIMPENLAFSDQSRAEIRRVSDMIMGEIIKLWELKH
ncbi:MAG: lysophospholipid acyltransferase family protein [bacterium]|nr:lysophospholipid acyltransferase family protein [bacterium]